MRADQIVIAAVTPPGVALLYFLLAGEVSTSEAIACAPVAAVVSYYAWTLARSGTVDLRIATRGLVSLGRGFLAVVPDCWRVGQGLLQAVWSRPEEMQGVIKHVPFRFGGPDCDDAGRRAAVAAGLSLAPNGFAMGMDHEREELIVHQLVPAPVVGDPEWPV